MISTNKQQTSQHKISKHLKQLIPNFDHLDLQVRGEVYEILKATIQANGNKRVLSQLSRMSDLEETPLLRAHLWKLMLETLDGNQQCWEKTRSNNSDLYKALRNKFLPSQVDEEDLLDLGNKNFDQELWDEIALDTKRTHSSLNFFKSQVSFSKVFANKPTRHGDLMGRILYIWGKTNPAVRYVQGMNQILAPLYYLEFQCLDQMHWNRESEVFFMFSSVMSSVIDMHIKEMDDCESGIMGRISSLNKFLRVVDKELWEKMEREGIYPQYYSFRWVALLLSQQFSLFDTIELWDFILSFSGFKRFFFVYCACLGILKIRKKEIMENDFITSLPLIQKLKDDVKINDVIKYAAEYYNTYKGKNIPQMYDNLIGMNEQEQKLDEVERSMRKGKGWNYSQMLKSTGNYLSKWANWKKKG